MARNLFVVMFVDSMSDISDPLIASISTADEYARRTVESAVRVRGLVYARGPIFTNEIGRDALDALAQQQDQNRNELRARIPSELIGFISNAQNEADAISQALAKIVYGTSPGDTSYLVYLHVPAMHHFETSAIDRVVNLAAQVSRDSVHAQHLYEAKSLVIARVKHMVAWTNLQFDHVHPLATIYDQLGLQV